MSDVSVYIARTPVGPGAGPGPSARLMCVCGLTALFRPRYMVLLYTCAVNDLQHSP